MLEARHANIKGIRPDDHCVQFVHASSMFLTAGALHRPAELALCVAERENLAYTAADISHGLEAHGLPHQLTKPALPADENVNRQLLLQLLVCYLLKLLQLSFLQNEEHAACVRAQCRRL